MTGRGMRRRGLGHASAAADCLVPHSLAQRSSARDWPAVIALSENRGSWGSCGSATRDVPCRSFRSRRVR